MIHEYSKNPHIYIITNLINGKQYIGQTNGNTKLYFCSGTIINRSIKARGKVNFSRKILIEGDFDAEQLNYLELLYIQIYNTLVPNGYNISENGRGVIQYGNIPWNKGGGNYSAETRKKMSDAKKDTILPLEQRKLISQSMMGKIPSIETREKIAEKKRIRILQYNLSGQYEKTWDSITEAALVCNSETTRISSCCKGKQKTVKTFIFRYETENYPLQLDVDLNIITKQIEHITPEGVIIVHKNVKETAKWLKQNLSEFNNITYENLLFAIRLSCRTSTKYKKHNFKYIK